MAFEDSEQIMGHKFPEKKTRKVAQNSRERRGKLKNKYCKSNATTTRFSFPIEICIF